MPNLTEKEILNSLFSEQTKYPVIDNEPNPIIEKEVEGYIARVEKEAELVKPITDNFGQALISPPSSQQPKIVLPVTQNQYLFGMTQKITQSIRWLVVWCQRLIKIFGPRAVFREAPAK